MERNGKIFYLIDYYSCMVYNVSLSEVITCLQLPFTPDFIDFMASKHVEHAGYKVNLKLHVEGITLEVPYSSFSQEFIDPITGEVLELSLLDSEKSSFDVDVESVRIEISGKGLMYLRHAGVDVENLLPQLDYNGHKYNITRCDHSYDLVDFCPKFIDDLSKAVKENLLDSGRVRTGTKGGMSYHEDHGTNLRILYFGSTGKRLLRIYDKRLEMISKKCYDSKCPYGEAGNRPSSWIRIELQLRRETAFNITKNGTPESILQYIYETFSVVREDRSLDPTFERLYDWRNIPHIIQNLHFV